MESKNKRKSSCLAVFGTGSEVGKSFVTTALCRALSNRGFRIAPFKAQNMSNNSGVTPEGLEMGRAQIVQAEASRIPPHTDMNPILLKPSGESGSQIILLGNLLRNTTPLEYYQKKAYLRDNACSALTRLMDQFPYIIIEGAGSCAEVNLEKDDIVNFKIAEYADAPVILVADIHRGGVFGQIIGTLACLPKKSRDRIAGIIINRFRGDLKLFAGATRWIEKKTRKQVLGILPWEDRIRIDAEDSVTIENPKPVSSGKSGNPAVAVIRFPHISNFTDVDPLTRIPGLDLFFIEKKQDLSFFKAIILPGSKHTRADLDWLVSTGWKEEIRKYVNHGGHLLGICGGYQMLGISISDPDGIEGNPGTSTGLELLPVETCLMSPKTTTLTRFGWGKEKGSGYEIHMGRTLRYGGHPLFSIEMRNGVLCRDEDGCRSANSKIMGTYLHGLFESPGIIRRWLKIMDLDRLKVPEEDYLSFRDKAYDELAIHFETHIRMDAIINLLQPKE
ncbi:MAG: cobyric acid synthase [Thermodesulfobacteriota bacterium]